MCESSNTSAPACPSFSGLHCLVAEDNIFALDIMNIFLQRQGFYVDCAENGQIALDKYLERPDKYSVIFMDLQMPVMGGYEAARKIRDSGCANCQTLPIIAMSGDPLNDLNEFGFTKSLKKPFEMQMICTILSEIIST